MASGPSSIALSQARDVLIVKPSSMGDVLHALPAVNALKASYPGVRFHWVVNEEWAPLLENNPDLSGVLAFPRRKLRGWRAPAGFYRWCQATRACVPGGFDAAIDFQGLLRSVLIAKGCHAGTIAGLSDAREGSRHFYTACADVRDTYHAVDRYLALAAMLGARIEGATAPLPAGQAIDGVAPQLLARAVVLHPFSRGQGKSLPVPSVEAIIRALAPHPVVLVGVGGPVQHVWPENTHNLLHQTQLAQLVWVLRHAGAVVSVDSGPMHLAAALSVPLLGLHTWSDPRKVGPWRRDAHVWKAGSIVQVAELGQQPETWCTAPGTWSPAPETAIAEWANRNLTTGCGRNT